MQTSTIVVLACLVAVVVAQAHQEQQVNTVQQLDFDTPAHESSPRNKRGLLLLKKKLILGALGLKAAKVGVGAGVVGALALKAKSKPKSVGTTYYHHGISPSLAVEVHRDYTGDIPLVIKY